MPTPTERLASIDRAAKVGAACLIAGVLLAGLLPVLTGCTFHSPPPTRPVVTALPATPTADAMVAVKLVIESDAPSTLRYSNGLDTFTILAEPNQVILFDAPAPWAVAGTAVTETDGFLACHLYVNGQLVSTFDGGDKLAFCGASEKNIGDDEPAPGTQAVSMKATTPAGAFVTWTSSHTGDSETTDPGNMTIGTNQPDGDARMLIVSEVKNDSAACEVMIDGFRMARDETDGTIGDIATCTGTIT